MTVVFSNYFLCVVYLILSGYKSKLHLVPNAFIDKGKSSLRIAISKSLFQKRFTYLFCNSVLSNDLIEFYSATGSGKKNERLLLVRLPSPVKCSLIYNYVFSFRKISFSCTFHALKSDKNQACYFFCTCAELMFAAALRENLWPPVPK